MLHLLATQVFLDMECISALLFTILGIYFCLYVLIMSGTGNVHACERAKGKNKGEVMSLFKTVQVLAKVDREMKIAAVGHQSGVSKIKHLFYKKNEDEVRRSIKASALLSAKFCV
jgi:hypothetical protein